MESALILLLIFMFFLGIIQVLWALIQAIFTRNPLIRKHFLYYFGGVAAYFAILAALSESFNHGYPVFASIHFFGSAAALAIYHVYIVSLSWKLREDLPRAEAAVLENPF